jgi:hypothetical protein
MTSVATRIASAIAGGLLLGCTSDHDLLAQRPGPTDDASISDAPADKSFPPNPRDVTTSSDARDPEPAGPWVLTLMNGVVDTGAVRFCFVPVVDGGEAPTDDPPFPPAPGLAFGAHVVVTALGTTDVRTTDLHPYLVVGADVASALSCKQILGHPTADAASDVGAGSAEGGPVADAGAPVAVSLPQISAGTLGEARSYLAVVSGCALPPPPAADAAIATTGDAGDASDADAAPIDWEAVNRLRVCGPALGPTTLGLSFVRMSRRADYAKVGFQVVNGSNATTPASFVIDNSFSNLTLFFGDSLALGQISPHAQPSYIDQTDFPSVKGAVDVIVEPPAGFSSFPAFQTTLGTVLTSSKVDSAELVGGSLFTFVLLGARSGQDAGSTSHAFDIRLIESSPDVAHD